MIEEKKEQEQVQHLESLDSRAKKVKEVQQEIENERQVNYSDDENRGGQCLER